MEQAVSSKEKLSEALKLLDEAAKDKKEEVQKLMKDKYVHLKESLFGSETKHSFDNVRRSASEAAHKARDVSEEKVKEMATQVDKTVRQNPWPYIGGVAVASLLLGYILGRKD